MTIDLPEFTVALKMARSTGSLPDEVEHRTFTVRGPARNAKAAEAIAFGLGHGINEATGHAWKFCGGSEAIAVQPTAVEQTELAKLRAQVADLADKLHKANAQVHSLEKATTTYANEVAAKDDLAERLAGALADVLSRFRGDGPNSRHSGWVRDEQIAAWRGAYAEWAAQFEPTEKTEVA